MSEASFVRTPRCAPDRGPLIDLVPTVDGLYLQVAGELDIATVPRLREVIGVLECAPRSVQVDLAAVRFADAAGMSPFFDSAVRRTISGLPPLTITAISRAVRRVVDLLADDRGARAFAAAAN
jgi:anti-anti-sigma regulatory factor